MNRPKPKNRAKIGLALLVLGLVLMIGPASRHVRAGKLLTRFADAKSTYTDLDETSFDLATPNGPTRAKIYSPKGASGLPGIVIVPGVHHLGVDEPRLQRFARTIAESGVVVMTPEAKALTDYQIRPESIATIGAAATELSHRIGRSGVGVMGMSFAGGLSLLATANPDTNANIAFCVAVGAHDDIRHVARFFAKNEAIEPDGRVIGMHAHPYGILVLVYEHLTDFFAPADVDVAHDAIKQWLWEDKATARETEKKLSPEGQATFDQLAEPPPPPPDAAKSGHFPAHPMGEKILSALETYGPALDAVSPHGHLQGIHVPVFVLHGAGDDVIPATEADWLGQDVPKEWLRADLVSPALQHVELQGEPTASQKWDLVHVMAGVLGEAAAEPKL